MVFTAPTSARDVRARLGITVSRRVGNAVIRNRLKRRIREWYRTGGRGRVDGLDLVVIARPPAARLEGVALRSMLDALVEVPS